LVTEKQAGLLFLILIQEQVPRGQRDLKDLKVFRVFRVFRAFRVIQDRRVLLGHLLLFRGLRAQRDRRVLRVLLAQLLL
jgi:hypothetical protein